MSLWCLFEKTAVFDDEVLDLHFMYWWFDFVLGHHCIVIVGLCKYKLKSLYIWENGKEEENLGIKA